MPNFRSILAAHADATRRLGDDASEVSLTPETIQHLIEQLEKLRQRNRIVFWINVMMILILFILALYLTIHYINDPDKLTLIFGATGVTISGLLVWMNRVWKEIVNVEMTIALAGSLDRKGLNSVITVLLSKY